MILLALFLKIRANLTQQTHIPTHRKFEMHVILVYYQYELIASKIFQLRSLFWNISRPAET